MKSLHEAMRYKPVVSDNKFAAFIESIVEDDLDDPELVNAMRCKPPESKNQMQASGVEKQYASPRSGKTKCKPMGSENKMQVLGVKTQDDMKKAKSEESKDAETKELIKRISPKHKFCSTYACTCECLTNGRCIERLASNISQIFIANVENSNLAEKIKKIIVK